MRLPVKRMAEVKKVANEAVLSEDRALRGFANSCLNQLSEVRRAVEKGDARRAHDAMDRAERMANRIRTMQGTS